jgi:hypothetical protein
LRSEQIEGKQQRQAHEAAYDKFKSDESDRELESLRRGYIRSLRQTLEHHLIAAEESGATSEGEAIKKLLKNLP